MSLETSPARSTAPTAPDDAATANDWLPLTPAQRLAYDEDGFLMLRGVLTPQEIALGLDIVERTTGTGAGSIAEHASFKAHDHTVRIRDAIARDVRLAHFLEHPGIVGPLVSMLGSSVHVLGSEVFVRWLSQVPLEYWHTDGGASLQRTLLAEGSQGLQLKVQVFLTDVDEDLCGNFLALPGTQRRRPVETVANCEIKELNLPLDADELPPGAVSLRARAGDVLVFPYSLWHAVAPNRVRARKTFIFRYGQLWHRPHDYLVQPEALLGQLSPRLRRMFGDFGPDVHPTDFYKPQDQDALMSGRRR